MDIYSAEIAIMNRAMLGVLIAITIIIPGALAEREHVTPEVRESLSLRLGNSIEIWQLVWTASPHPYCHLGEIDMAMTCPCDGFAYGEAGHLKLVRSRAHQPDEVLPLDNFFRRDNSDPAISKSFSIVQKWPYQTSDYIRYTRKDLNLAQDIQRRPVSRIMIMKDYNRDGWNAKFLLQIQSQSCGDRRFVAIGITKNRPYLHAMGSKALPGKPLILPLRVWEKMNAVSGPFSITVGSCGDHFSDREHRLLVHVEEGAIDVIEEEWSCSPSGKAEMRLTRRQR